MAPVRTVLTGVGLAVAATLAANAQPQYSWYFYGQPPAAPPAWSYDPYTSGLSPCPQWRPGDSTPCHAQMPPTYGQPSFGPSPD